MVEISSYWRNEPQVNTNESQLVTGAPTTMTNLANSSTNNSVSDHNSASQTAGHVPTEGGRETGTGSKTPGYAEIEKMLSDRLANDPDYQALSEKLEKWKNIESDFALIDRYSGFITGDGTVTLDNIRAVANNDHPDAAAANAAAKRLLGAIDIWNEIAKGDNIAGTHDVMGFVAGMRDQLKAMKESARADIKAEVGAATATNTTGSTSGSAGGAAGAAGAEGASEPLFKAPTLSTKPGMEGAVENVGNTLTAIGNATADLMAKLANPDLKPEERQKLQAKYNELQQLQSMLTAMYTQLQEAIANLMKMYSDVAQNSIRNMK